VADITEELKPDGFASGKVKRNLVLIVIAVLLLAAVIGVALQFSGKPSVGEKQAAKKQEEQRQQVSQMPVPRPEDLTAILGGNEQPRTNSPVNAGADNRTDSLFPDGSNAAATAKPSAVDPAIAEAARLRASVAASGILALESDVSSSHAQQAPQPSPLDGLRDMLALQSAQAGGTAPDYASLVKAAQGGASAKTSTAQNVEWAKQAENASARGAVYVDPPMSPHTLYQGAVIPSVLVTTINSDLPGYITAQVTEDVFDSVHGRNLVIPKGARIVGTYNNEIADGQERLMAAFDRVILPNGASIQLKAMTGADGQGRSGMNDEVNRHFWKRFGPPVLVAALARLVTKTPNNVTVNGGGTTSLSDATGQILVETARQMLESGRDIRNTVIINQGYKFNILVNRDLVFLPEMVKGGSR